MAILEFTLIALAAWNISSLLVQEEGPFNILGKMRYFAGVDVGPDMQLYKRHGIGTFRDGMAGVFLCIWCMSRWVAAILVVLYMLFPTPVMILCAILAVSTGAILVDGWTRK